jgi:dolichol kinase
MMVLCIIGALIIGKKVDTYLGVKRKRMIIVARKYFHLVAVVLFLKPTLLAPSMMGLSYAVATALLILVENLRNEHESPETIRKYSEVVANGSIRPKKSFITDFFELFFDEKDHRAKEGGFVITHISLLCGCAMPLWIHLFYPRCSLTPFLGIICVGVGDAAGAIVGTFYGKHKWPDSRRTIEGSVAMLISMSIVTIWLLRAYNLDMKYDVFIFILMIVTIVEAATYQLDNICLPLLSVILLYAVDCT